MPWYYAGPGAKPIGPVSVEELHARHLSGIVTPGTYVIEHSGQPVENWTWKPYGEVFPANPPPPAPPPVTLPALPVAQTHPLFPSAAPAPTRSPVFPSAARPDPYYHNVKSTNGWCAWGFGLGLAGFFFSFACGTGLLPALLAIPLCVVGLAKVHRNSEQSGRGLAVAGLALSAIALLISLIFFLWLAIPIMKSQGLTVTEETSNDSE